MRPDLSTGVVTLLFTDIEGSTRLLAELREGYVDALGGHRDVLRSACAEHDGVIVDSQGDAMLMAFERPSDAVRVAEMVQRGLSAGRVRVRIGIHSGTPELQDGAYVGMDVHRGARIAARRPWWAGAALGGRARAHRGRRRGPWQTLAQGPR